MTAGAAYSADDADARSERDNPWRQKRQRNTDHAHTPHQRAGTLLNGAPQGRGQTGTFRDQISLVRSKARRLSFKFRAKNLRKFVTVIAVRGEI